MLERKPYIGENLFYNPIVAGCVLPSYELTVKKIEGNILHFAKADGEMSLIIWQFNDGLNQCLSHQQMEVSA